MSWHVKVPDVSIFSAATPARPQNTLAGRWSCAASGKRFGTTRPVMQPPGGAKGVAGSESFDYSSHP